MAVPAHALQAGRNVLHVRVWAPFEGVAYGNLSPPIVGDAAKLSAVYEQQRVIELGAETVGAFVGIVFGTYTLLLWLRRRGEAMYLCFGWSALLHGLHVLRDGGKWPLPFAELPDRVVHAFIDYASVTLLVIYLLRYAGWRWPRVERGLWAWVGLSMLLQLRWDFYNPDSLPYWILTGAAVYLAAVPLTVAITWHRRDMASLLLVPAAAWWAGSFVLSFLQANVLLRFPLTPLQLTPMIALIGWQLMDRFAKSLTEAEMLSAELEQRVADKGAELERNYARMQQVERQSAITEERSRIMSDMHDGIGAQLISTLSLVEHGDASSREVAAALRECIDDLRLAIDSLEPTEDDLLPVLGNLRYRLEPRLKANGIALDWQVGDVPKLSCLTPRNVLHVLRILQEAFTNVLKHAKANRIRVDTQVQDGGVAIRVSDNGTGFDRAPSTRGHGLSNMRARAQAIGASLNVVPSASGTTLSLLLPIG